MPGWWKDEPKECGEEPRRCLMSATNAVSASVVRASAPPTRFLPLLAGRGSTRMMGVCDLASSSSTKSRPSPTRAQSSLTPHASCAQRGQTAGQIKENETVSVSSVLFRRVTLINGNTNTRGTPAVQ